MQQGVGRGKGTKDAGPARKVSTLVQQLEAINANEPSLYDWYEFLVSLELVSDVLE